MKKCIVVGAGLAGLLTAALLAKRGVKVLLFERSNIVGGRSHVVQQSGFTMSYGAHALLAPKVHPMSSILKELDIRLTGYRPSMTKYKLFVNGQIVSSPIGSGAFTTPAIDGLKNRFVFFKHFFTLMKAKPNFPKDMNVQDWIDQHVKEPSVKKVIRAFASVSIYDQALDRYSLNEFVRHTSMEYAKSDVLLYIRFDQLFAELMRVIKENHGEISLSSEVIELVTQNGRVIGVKIDGVIEEADAVIVNLPPKAIAKLVQDQALHEEISQYVNQTEHFTFVYDVQLSKRLRTDITNVLDLDQGVYINDVSMNVPSSAPDGMQLLQCLRFLDANEQLNDAHAEKSQQIVEQRLDLIYPGWREYVIRKRIIKRALVNGIARRVGNRLLPFQSATTTSLYFVGDSTVGKGGLGIPCYDSAWEVASLVSKQASYQMQ